MSYGNRYAADQGNDTSKTTTSKLRIIFAVLPRTVSMIHPYLFRHADAHRRRHQRPGAIIALKGVILPMRPIVSPNH